MLIPEPIDGWILVPAPLVAVSWFFYAHGSARSRTHGSVPLAKLRSQFRWAVALCLALYGVGPALRPGLVSYWWQTEPARMGLLTFYIGGLALLCAWCWALAWWRRGRPDDSEAWKERVLAGRPSTVFSWIAVLWAGACVVGVFLVATGRTFGLGG